MEMGSKILSYLNRTNLKTVIRNEKQALIMHYALNSFLNVYLMIEQSTTRTILVYFKLRVSINVVSFTSCSVFQGL